MNPHRCPSPLMTGHCCPAALTARGLLRGAAACLIATLAPLGAAAAADAAGTPGGLQARAWQHAKQAQARTQDAATGDAGFTLALKASDPLAELRQHSLLRLDMGAQGRLRLKVRGGGLALQWQAEW